MASWSEVSRLSLASWRQLAPEDFSPDGATRLLTLLLDITAFAEEAGRRELTADASRQASAAIAIADRLGRSAGDLTFSWLTLAALLGDKAASAQVAAELMHRAVLARFRGKRREARSLGQLAAAWFEPLAGELAGAFGPGRRSLAERLVAGLLPEAPPPTGQEIAAASTSAGLVVLPQGIPSLRNDRDDRALIEGWKTLTKPLPLAEGPPAGLLRTVLALEFPWMEDAIAVVAEELGLRQALGLPGFHLRPLLLVGPPGTGKTFFVRRLAELNGVGYAELSAAGSADNRLLAGTARGWGSAQPGFVLQLIRRCQAANPLVLVDEIDKCRADGRNGDIRATLLALTEPVTARAWLDECLCSPADLSAVSWMFTANDTQSLKGPLLSRLRAIPVPAPGPGHFDAVITGIRRDIARRWQVESLPDPPTAVLDRLRRACRSGVTLRRLRSAYERALGQAVASGRRLH